MITFTAGRRTFAFAARSLGLFYFLPSFFSSLSSVLKSQCLDKKRRERRREARGREEEERKREGKKEAFISRPKLTSW